MVDITNYLKENARTNRVTVELIKGITEFENRRAVIIGPGEFRELKEHKRSDGKVVPPKTAFILFVSMNGKEYEWIVNAENLGMLAQDIGSTDTKKWVGAVVQYSVAGTSVPYVKATLVSRP